MGNDFAKQLVHGTTIAFGGKAVLLRGPSGSGKSSLALRLMESPGNGLGPRLLLARLIADDQTLLEMKGGEIWASAPANIAGLLEVRGLGLLKVKAVSAKPLALVVDLVPSQKIERMPEPQEMILEILSHSLPYLKLDPTHDDSLAKLRVVINQLNQK